jgi:hypothetical protein
MKSVVNFLSVTILSLILISCSGEMEIEIPEYLSDLEELSVYPLENELETSIDLIPETTYGNIEEVIIGRVVGVVVDAHGRVYIGDFDSKTIHVFQDDGSYHTSIGREGDGPGEFRGISQMRIGDEKIHVFDWNQQRIHAFSIETLELSHTTSLDFEEERNVDLSGWMANSFYVQDDENYLVRFSRPFRPDNMHEERTYRLYKVSSEGRMQSDMILELPVGEALINRDIRMVMGVPYSRNALVEISGETIYKLWTEDLAIRKYDINGRFLSAFYYSVNKSRLSREEVLEQYEHEQMRQMIRNATLPETWPAVGNYLIDDENRFWISRIIDERDAYEWWVLEANGELITRFTWPRSKSIRQVKHGALYTLETDQETGLQEIVKYLVDIS